jgi:O-antigen/teichoic acid export membrane protein
MALAILFVVGLREGGRGVLLSQLLAELLLCAYLIPATLRGLTLRFSMRDARDLLAYGLALVPASLLSFLIHLSDRYFLKYFTSLSVVGIYALGYRFGEILYFMILAFELAYPPFLFGHLKSPGAQPLLARVCTYYLAVMALLWLGLSLFAEEVVTLMAHPAYHDAYRVIPWIAGAFLLQGVGAVWNVGMMVHRIMKYRLLISLSTAILTLGLNFLLIPRYGMMGAAGAALAAFGFQFVVQVTVGYRLYPIPYEWGRIVRLIAVGAGIYVTGSLIEWGSMPVAIAGKSVLILSAPLLLYAIGFFERGESDVVKRLVGSFRRGSTALARTSGK